MLQSETVLVEWPNLVSASSQVTVVAAIPSVSAGAQEEKRWLHEGPGWEGVDGSARGKGCDETRLLHALKSPFPSLFYRF